jgi:hypothetical protein
MASNVLPAAPTTPATLGAWLREGLRSALFLAPRWPAARAAPVLLLALVLSAVLLEVMVHRLHIEGDAQLYWPALTTYWLPTAAAAWVSWFLAPARAGRDGAGGASGLMALWIGQSIGTGVAFNLITALRDRGSDLPLDWLVWAAGLGWTLAAQAWLFWRASAARAVPRLMAILGLSALSAWAAWSHPVQLWYPPRDGAEAAAPAAPLLTAAQLETQVGLLPAALQALPPQRPGRIDVYAIGFAPFAEEDVFLRESRLVARTMGERFEARTLQLVNHRSTVDALPWATPANLKRTLDHLARTIDREHDIIFIHLSSHGVQSGALAASLTPLGIDELTPQALRSMLDEAGIRHRIVSVSACYSGRWVPPLAGESTLVMTAADADHTSYGCGRQSELTFFGRALYAEALLATRDFEAALKTARAVIAGREREAGKDDGHSNPQIALGAPMRAHLARLRAELEAAAK